MNLLTEKYRYKYTVHASSCKNLLTENAQKFFEALKCKYEVKPKVKAYNTKKLCIFITHNLHSCLCISDVFMIQHNIHKT